MIIILSTYKSEKHLRYVKKKKLTEKKEINIKEVKVKRK